MLSCDKLFCQYPLDGFNSEQVHARRDIDRKLMTETPRWPGFVHQQGYRHASQVQDFNHHITLRKKLHLDLQIVTEGIREDLKVSNTLLRLLQSLPYSGYSSGHQPVNLCFQPGLQRNNLHSHRIRQEELQTVTILQSERKMGSF